MTRRRTAAAFDTLRGGHFGPTRRPTHITHQATGPGTNDTTRTIDTARKAAAHSAPTATLRRLIRSLPLRHRRATLQRLICKITTRVVGGQVPPRTPVFFGAERAHTATFWLVCRSHRTVAS